MYVCDCVICSSLRKHPTRIRQVPSSILDAHLLYIICQLRCLLEGVFKTDSLHVRLCFVFLYKLQKN